MKKQPSNKKKPVNSNEIVRAQNLEQSPQKIMVEALHRLDMLIEMTQEMKVRVDLLNSELRKMSN